MKIIDKLKDCSIDKNVAIASVAASVMTYFLTSHGYEQGCKESENMITRLKDYNDELYAEKIELLNQINKMKDAK